jgi:hypothetical protein
LVNNAAAHFDACDAGFVGCRHVLKLSRRHNRLASGGDPRHEPLAALGVKLAHHIVEQQQWRLAALVGQHLALGQKQRQQSYALLPLGAVDAKLSPLAAKQQLVAVRTVAGETALKIGAAPLKQLSGKGLRAVGLAAGSVAQL